jgi:hypothetical protein
MRPTRLSKSPMNCLPQRPREPLLDDCNCRMTNRSLVAFSARRAAREETNHKAPSDCNEILTLKCKDFVTHLREPDAWRLARAEVAHEETGESGKVLYDCVRRMWHNLSGRLPPGRSRVESPQKARLFSVGKGRFCLHREGIDLWQFHVSHPGSKRFGTLRDRIRGACFQHTM